MKGKIEQGREVKEREGRKEGRKEGKERKGRSVQLEGKKYISRAVKIAHQGQVAVKWSLGD